MKNIFFLLTVCLIASGCGSNGFEATSVMTKMESDVASSSTTVLAGTSWHSACEWSNDDQEESVKYFDQYFADGTFVWMTVFYAPVVGATGPTCVEQAMAAVYEISGQYEVGAEIAPNQYEFNFEKQRATLKTLTDQATDDFNNYTSDGQVVGTCGITDWTTNQAKDVTSIEGCGIDRYVLNNTFYMTIVIEGETLYHPDDTNTDLGVSPDTRNFDINNQRAFDLISETIGRASITLD